MKLDYAIGHVLRRDKATLSDRVLALNPAVTSFLEAYIKASQESSKRRAANFAVGSEARQWSADSLRGKDDLVSASRLAATRLHTLISQDRRISLSVLLVCVFTDDDDLRHVGYFKLDPADGLSPSIERNDGKTVVSLSIAKDVLPTSKEALQKSAIVSNPASKQKFNLFVVDTQSPDGGVAHFFLSDFLDAEHARTDAQRTGDFALAITNTKNGLNSQQQKRFLARIDVAYRAALQQQQLNVTEFVENLDVDASVRAIMNEQMEAHVPDREFLVDRKTADRVLKKRKFRGDHGLKVEVLGEHYQDLISTHTNEQGQHVIQIVTEVWNET